MKLKSVVLLAVVLALCAAVLAPAASGATGVTVKLKGPRAAAQGATIRLSVTIKDTNDYTGGYGPAVLLQNKNGHLRRIASKTVVWATGGSVGFAFLRVKAVPSAMGIAMYRVAWKSPAGIARSNVWRVEID